MTTATLTLIIVLSWLFLGLIGAIIGAYIERNTDLSPLVFIGFFLIRCICGLASFILFMQLIDWKRNKLIKALNSILF